MKELAFSIIQYHFDSIDKWFIDFQRHFVD